MSLIWNVDSESRLVTATANGNVTRADVDAFLDSVEGETVRQYCKVIDVRQGSTTMDASDLLALGVRVRSLHSRPTGPVAIILPKTDGQLIGRLLGILAAAKRPLRLFDDLPPAMRWIRQVDQPTTPCSPDPYAAD